MKNSAMQINVNRFEYVEVNIMLSECIHTRLKHGSP